MAEIPMSGVTGGGVGLRATMRTEAPANSSATATPRIVGTAPPPEPEWPDILDAPAIGNLPAAGGWQTRGIGAPDDLLAGMMSDA
jgi:hypothetical protein